MSIFVIGLLKPMLALIKQVHQVTLHKISLHNLFIPVILIVIYNFRHIHECNRIFILIVFSGMEVSTTMGKPLLFCHFIEMCFVFLFPS